MLLNYKDSFRLNGVDIYNDLKWHDHVVYLTMATGKRIKNLFANTLVSSHTKNLRTLGIFLNKISKLHSNYHQRPYRFLCLTIPLKYFIII